MKNSNNQASNTKSALLWTATVLLAIGLLVLRVVYPELLWATIAAGVLLLASLAGLILHHKAALRSRSAAFGAQSAVTVVLVIGIVGVLNFLVSQHPLKWDLTKNRLHTLSQDTEKLMKGLKAPVKATLFAKLNQREQFRPVLDNYKALNATQFDVEYVDPDKEQLRTKQAGVKKYGTLLLNYQGRESRIEEVSEEKLTNALIKLLKDKSQSLCVITGHGERSFASTEADGYSTVKKSLEDQSYALRDVSLAEGKKALEGCDAIAIIGPSKSFFAPEIAALREYLSGGGRALVALDLNIKGGNLAPELDPILQEWYVKRVQALVLDPMAQRLGGEAIMPMLVKYSPENPITREMREQAFAPFLMPIETLPGAPAELKVNWLAQTDPRSWGVVDLSSIQKGGVAGRKPDDKAGPLNAGVFVEGKQKDSKAARPTRMVVFGSSYFATNNFSRFGANMDLFLNTVSWLLEDESFISIHAKEEGPGKVEMTEKQARALGLINV
ncbi:MAG TPA: GldG family protein, partial [Bdellovibrionota bacterium]|nr:GldG family protein [Bdellovibrionota bacterium]